MANIAELIFLLQQLGIALGLGAGTFSLLVYVSSFSDGVVNTSEKHLIHATSTVQVIALFLVGVTSAIVTGAHFLAGEIGIISAPVFVSEWLLLSIIVLSAILLALRAIRPFSFAIVSCASWYALFIIHTLVPNVSWDILGLGYVLWIAIFVFVFWIVKKRGTSVPSVSLPKNIEPAVTPSTAQHIRPLPTRKTQPVPSAFNVNKGLQKASSTFSVAEEATLVHTR